jgi:hypothetical protein
MIRVLLAFVTAFTMTTSDAAAQHDQHAQMNARGEKAMGFDQQATTHHFYLYEDGGEIEVTVKDPKDKANLDAIRSHLPHISSMFAAGDFSMPHFVHADDVPGTAAMSRMRDRIAYAYEDVPNGGRVRINTRFARALSAVHEFLRYQIGDHKTGDSTQISEKRDRPTRPKP